MTPNLAQAAHLMLSLASHAITSTKTKKATSKKLLSISMYHASVN